MQEWQRPLVATEVQTRLDPPAHPRVFELHRPRPSLPEVPVRLQPRPVVEVFPPGRLLARARHSTPVTSSPASRTQRTGQNAARRWRARARGRGPRLGDRGLDLRPLVPLVPAGDAHHLRLRRDRLPPPVVIVPPVGPVLRRRRVPRTNGHVRVPAAGGVRRPRRSSRGRDPASVFTRVTRMRGRLWTGCAHPGPTDGMNATLCFASILAAPTWRGQGFQSSELRLRGRCGEEVAG